MQVLIRVLIGVLILLISGCEGELTNDKKENIQSMEVDFSKETTNNLCQVANYLNNHDFLGDFYIYNNEIKWGMEVDSIRISKEIIDLLVLEKIEYVARAQGIYVFGFYPDKNYERSLLLNTKPSNPLITSGNNKPMYKKLSNSMCLYLNWYYQVY